MKSRYCVITLYERVLFAQPDAYRDKELQVGRGGTDVTRAQRPKFVMVSSYVSAKRRKGQTWIRLHTPTASLMKYHKCGVK